MPLRSTIRELIISFPLYLSLSLFLSLSLSLSLSIFLKSNPTIETKL